MANIKTRDGNMVEKVIESIKTEHNKIMNILNELEASEDPERIEVLYKSLKQEMIENMNKEENCIYQRIKDERNKKIKDDKKKELEDLDPDHSKKEHHLIKDFLQRLNLVRINDTQWKTFLSEFKRLFESHALNEQKILTKAVKTQVSMDELKEILKDLNVSQE